MKKTHFKRSLVALSVSALFAMTAPTHAANNTAGSMKGKVADAANSSALAGAVVTIVNKANGSVATSVVGRNGSFRIPNLAIGDYKITITKEGYQTQVIESAKVSIGNEVNIDVVMTSGDVEIISVTGSRVALVDASTPEIALTITADEVARLPIALDVVNVALLAPGTTQGDAAFGNLASFGGASVAENTFIINGVNVTGFRRGTSISEIPFSAYDQFQVKTGGYSAQFGRSTGGVVNAITKRGNNGWDFGIEARWEPDALRENRDTVRYKVASANGDIQPFDVFSTEEHLEVTDFETEVWASGDIIEDTLFFYGLYQAQTKERKSHSLGYYNGAEEWYLQESEANDPLWMARIDWNITDDHSLMIWGFSDEKDYYNKSTSSTTGDAREPVTKTGGNTWSVKYDGRINDWLSIDALYAEVEFNSTRQDPADEACPAVYDTRSGSWVEKGCWVNFTASLEADKREQSQLNFNVDYFDDHSIRMGVDYENNTSTAGTFYSGHVYYRYGNLAAGSALPNGYVAPNDLEYVRTRVYENGGTFTSKSMALYIEDTWSITDDVTARVGLRSESFENLNANDEAFIEISNQLAPRLGIAWDVFSDGNSKLFANWGRYHIPVASNTNVRMAGAELYYEDYNLLNGVDANDLPDVGASLGDRRTFADGSAADPAEILDTSIKPMYQDELIIGFEHTINDDWSTGVKFVHRDLKSIIDDITIDEAIKANGWDYDPDHGGYYVLTNPNTDITVFYDTDGDGVREQVQLSADQLGYPEPKRIYNALEFSLTKGFTDGWALNTSYTWAKSYGNAEGYVKSDNGQDDAGLTTDWDYPYLMDGANGPLPNDRRHTFKVYGAYEITDNLSIGANMIAQSGRPKSAFGDSLPDSYGADYQYGATYYPYNTACQRGCMGREGWRFKMDLNMVYNVDFIDGVDAQVRMDIFNLFNVNNVLKTEETLSIGGDYNPAYGLPTSVETPRYVRLSASIKF
ncbi:hypothetical protein PULV_a0240 [Pseudoalteromonas ulvae UL12]|uniref:TonB-dependent receptor n=1 Tax=Pseudoalteromonas ulvae TaxID=107327 RepID=UPI00186B79B5|nr:TonB-dependent receptor [Pseudoalteromonas ulvae]MBE0362698.1 hypothetical protein [Pseudoalteromonas ulvae UL12]